MYGIPTHVLSFIPCSFQSDQKTSIFVVRNVIAETEIPGSEELQDINNTLSKDFFFLSSDPELERERERTGGEVK